MRKYLLWSAVASIFIAATRLISPFTSFWQSCVSRPVLSILARFSSALPFCLLEWCALALLVCLFISLINRSFLRRLLQLALVLTSTYLLVWYPLYFTANTTPTASEAQLTSLCRELISSLNASELDFSNTEPLPAKFARFPDWMEACGISGFASFFTGEAILSPNLPDCSKPFVAMHESMHLEGWADEGAANIAAYEACLLRGGSYADSARLWALRYAMGMLRGTPLYYELLDSMDNASYSAFLSCGGSWISREKPAPLRLLKLLGIDKATRNYENLALHLAAAMPQ